MTMNATLSAEKRSDSGKGAARQMRAAGRIPAVVYGQGDDGLSLSLDAHEAGLLFHRISVENTIVNLDIEGEKEPVSTLVREVQTHPYKSEILHVDFYRIQKGVEVEVDVPVHLEGSPVGVVQGGGNLQLVIHDLSVACIPSKIPDHITVDVSGLDIGEALHVSDLDLPEGVRSLIDEERTVATVNAPRGGVGSSEDEESEGEAAGEAAPAEGDASDA